MMISKTMAPKTIYRTGLLKIFIRLSVAPPVEEEDPAELFSAGAEVDPVRSANNRFMLLPRFCPHSLARFFSKRKQEKCNDCLAKMERNRAK